jgi:excisionase family DNA binding protein
MSDDLIERAFCTTRQAASLLGVSVGTVQLWSESGVLQAWKTAGGHRRVLRDSVDQLLRKSPARAAPPAAAPTAPAPVAAMHKRPMVMVVEDDLSLLRLYEARISRWPRAPEVMCFDNAVLALLRMGTHRPDLLIVDLNMPGMDGFNLLHCLRHAPEFGAATIAVVTGMDPARIEERGGLPSDVAVFPKPVPFDGLLKVWNSLHEDRRLEEVVSHGRA